MYVTTRFIRFLFRSKKENFQSVAKTSRDSDSLSELCKGGTSIRLLLFPALQCRNTSNRAIEYPNAAPKNTSDGKCARVVTREKPIAVAAPYATHGTHL